MNLRRILRTGITASAIAHLSALLLLLFFTEVHPFGSVTAEPITVDIVSPDDVPPPQPAEVKPSEPADVTPPKKEFVLPDLNAKPSDTFEQPSKSAAQNSAPAAAPQSSPPPAAAKAAAAQQQQQAALSTPSPVTPPAAVAQPAPVVQPANAQPPPAAPATSQTPAYAPPQPDLSIKYHVMLGLPPYLPVSPPEDKSGDVGVAEAAQKADVASGVVAEFRRHIKTCSKLPASISPSDKVRIKLQVLMTPEGRLAAEPIVVEGQASQKGVDLKQSAIDALMACQPYAMLPADRYREWKVLDLSFTPQDF